MAFNIFFPIQAGFKMAIPQGILFLGLIPALIIWFIFLKRYDGYYTDSGAFKTFMIGIFLGAISALIRIIFNPDPLLIIFLVLFAFFEPLLKTIILNMGRLQRKKETIIYGLSLGLGFGTVFTPFLIIQAAAAFEGEGLIVTNSHLALITIGSIGVIIFHGATGAIIGYGVYKGNLIKYLLLAIILQIPFNVLFDLAHFYRTNFFSYVQFGLVVYGAIFFFYVVTKIMPQILKNSDKKSSKN